MPKKVSEIQIKEIINLFLAGETLDQLSTKYNCTKITINRYLKKFIDEKIYKSLCNKNKKIKIKIKDKDVTLSNNQKKESKDSIKDQNNYYFDSNLESPLFVELKPLDDEIDNLPQKDFSSVPISEVDFPKVVYMIVDNKIELEIKYLKEYPEWQFLSKEELNRKTIEIYLDIKIAKSFCNKEQKVIKVPNTNIFKLVAPILVSKGISRIVCPDKLIAL